MEKKEQRIHNLESHAQVLRGLINYHKRMMMMGESGCGASEKCPKATILNDVYLEALEESLRLIEREIASFRIV